MPNIFVVNSRGERTPFARRHLLGSLVEAGVPFDLAHPRVLRVADAIATIGATEISTDNLRRALDVAAEGGGATELGAALRTPSLRSVDDATAIGSLLSELPTAAVAIDQVGFGRFEVAYLAPVAIGVRAIVRTELGAELWSEPVTVPAGVMMLGPELLAPGVGHGFEIRGAHDQILATSILPPTWWPQLAPPLPPEDEAERILEDMRRLEEEYDRLAEIIKWFPQWRLSRIMRAVAQLLARINGLEVRIVIALGKWLACSSEALAGLSTPELRSLLELLLEQLRLELETLEPGASPERAAIEAALHAVEAALRDWDPTWVADHAREVLGALKALLAAEYPVLLRLLAEFWSEIVRELDALGPTVLRMVISTAAKTLLKKLIVRILARRFGTDMAKRMTPWVGIAVDTLELLAILDLVDRLNGLSKALDQRMCDLMLTLKGLGWGWPSNFAYVWLNKRYRGALVRICPMKRCARRRPDGCTRWSAACPVTFADGHKCKTAVLTPDKFDPVTGQYVVPYDLDVTSADAPCGDDSTDPLLVCYAFLRVTLWYWADGRLQHMTSNLVIGAK